VDDALRLLAARLDAAADRDRPLTLWWRDDDAVAVGPRLEALVARAARHSAPLALAVIPSRATDDLLRLCEREGVTVLQHGVGHTDHEPVGNKKAELGAAREPAAIIAACRRARARLEGSRAFLPVMVPPWNRMRQDLAAPLRDAGYTGLSLFAGPLADAPLRRVDTHIDPVDWRGRRGILSAGALAAMMDRALAVAGPVGLLTHHAAQSAEVDDFVEAFATLATAHPGAVWARPAELFAPPGRRA